MELNIDTGVEEFRVNGRGVLRFNPADPNLYHRFFAAGTELDGYDTALTKALAALDGDEQQRAAAGLALLNEYDGKIKKLLTGIFGAENDFDAILGGVNLAGVGANGKRVVQNLLEALTPILREGAERRLTAAADAAAARVDAARRRLMRGELAWPNDEREGRAKSALIRRCGATFSLRAKSRLRRLRSDTRLRAQPLGEGFREGGKPCLQK